MKSAILTSWLRSRRVRAPSQPPSPRNGPRLETDSPPAIVFPSALQAQAVTLVLPPRSLDLTTMTDFDLRLFEMSQSRMVLSAEAERKREEFLGCQATEVRAATCPLRTRVRQLTVRVGQEDARALGVPKVSDVHVALVELGTRVSRQAR